MGRRESKTGRDGKLWLQSIHSFKEYDNEVERKPQREILDSRKTGYVLNSGDNRNMQGARKTEIRNTDKEAESTEGREETGYQS